MVDRLALSSAVRGVAPRTPVLVAHKVRGRAAMRAARSHAGAAMEASEAMPDLEAAGAVLATDLVDLADRTAAMVLQPRARGRRVAVLSTSGGAAVAAASHLEDMRLEVPVLPEQVQRALVQWLPEHGTAANPVNLGGALPAGSLRPVVEGVLGQPTVDGTVVLAVGVEVPARATAAAEAATARGKPVVGVTVRAPLTAKAMREAGIPVYPSPARAARAYQALVPGPL
jgi:acyl-CoA synthetase (NDP forming)